jgi:hypothetical protein
MHPDDIMKCVRETSKKLNIDETRATSVIFKHLYGDCKNTFDAITQSDFEITDHIINLGGGKCYVLDSIISMIQSFMSQGRALVDPFSREKFTLAEIEEIIKEKKKIDPNFNFHKKDFKDAVFLVRPINAGFYKLYIAKSQRVFDILNLHYDASVPLADRYLYLGILPGNITENETNGRYNSETILIKIQELWEQEKLVVFNEITGSPEVSLLKLPEQEWLDSRESRKKCISDLIKTLDELDI